MGNIYKGKEEKRKSRQVDKNSTFQVRVDRGWWKILSRLRTDTGKGFKELVEGALVNTYGIINGNPEILTNHKKHRQAKDDSILTRN